MESQIRDRRAVGAYLRGRGFLAAGSAISISGLPGFTSWPSVGSVEHELPTGDVRLYSARFGDLAQLRIVGLDGVVSTFDSHSGSIVVPAGFFQDALTNRAKMTLTVAGIADGGYILFLPVSEDEPFSLEGSYIYSNGTVLESSQYNATDLVSTEGVTDIVYSGLTTINAHPLAAYNESGRFVRLLLEQGNYSSVHVIPDGSYSYIRACAKTSDPYSLTLYFRDRRRKTNKKEQHE